MDWSELLYFGTWQLSGDFRPITENEVKEIVGFAWQQGITKFDTANVYGNGSVEKILGNILPPEAKIVTKLPAIQKPRAGHNSDIKEYYPEQWLTTKFASSMERLRRFSIYGLLLHNWCASWGNDYCGPLSFLTELRRTGAVKKIGISIPDGFTGNLPLNLVRQLNLIEAPYNGDNRWIAKNAPMLQANGIEIILRSIFRSGAIKNQTDSGRDPRSTITEAMHKKYSVVIGMTQKIHILENIQKIKEETSHG